MPFLNDDRMTVASDDNTWIFSRTEDFSQFIGFDCGIDDLNDYITNDAKLHQEELIAQTYGFSFMDERGLAMAPVAFLSLSNDSIELYTRQKKDIPENLRNYKEMPAVKIGRLAVKKDMQHKNVGTLLLNCVRFMITRQNRTGCRFITANVSPDVIDFYVKNNFRKLSSKMDASKFTLYSDLKRFMA